MSDHYLITAYRWGHTNDHRYIVGCYSDQEKAEAIAYRECSERGGKYGVEVERIVSEKIETTAYFPSVYGEDSAAINSRAECAERIGLSILSEEAYGELTLDKVREFIAKAKRDQEFWDAIRKESV